MNAIRLDTAELRAAYDVVSNALVSKDRPLATIEIGDTKQAEFFPQLKIGRFSNEVNASFRLVCDEPADIAYEKDALIWRTASVEARFYGTDDVETKDAHEFSVTLLVPPKTNVVTFTIQTKGLAFTKQPTFANGPDAEGYLWQETGRWPGHIQRHLPHVDGSYVAYGTSEGDYSALGGHNYRSGKVCHIYRPWAEDAHGTRVWCDLDLDGAAGLLTVTVPQDFLDAAAYPVLVDPTFGYSGTAASDDNIGGARILCLAVSTPASNGTLTSITIQGRIRADTAGAPHPNHSPAIYSDVVGVPTALIEAPNGAGSLYGASDAEVTTNMAGTTSITSGTQYWLGSRQGGAVTNYATSDAWFKYDASGGTNLYYRVTSNDSAWEATTAGYSSASGEKVYIFGTYTAAGAGDTQEWLSRSRIDRKQPVQVSY